MNRCAVLGSPIAHSLSPIVHRTAYAVLELGDWRYDAFEVDAAGFGDFVATCDADWVGLSCTMPLKEELLDHGLASERARVLNAANTYLFARGGEPARVENTDVEGITGPLRRLGVEAVESAVLVGAGATARSALWGLADLGVRRVSVLARDAGRASASLGALAAARGVQLEVRPWAAPTDVGRRDVLVSTVPIPLEDRMVAGLAPAASVVFDVHYGHGPSRFAEPVAAAGGVLLDGIDMLVGQALGQIRLMTGRECPPEPLLDACRAELARRAR